jgi:hypothetical protein
MSEDRIRRKVRVVGPALTLIYGPPGTGKTTAALTYPKPVLIPVEEGVPASWPDGRPMEVDQFDPPQTYAEFIDNINTVGSSDEFQTLIVDTLDKLEPMIWRHICEAHNVSSIEDVQGGFGKGYAAAAEEWASLIQLLKDLVKYKGMHVVMLAHSDAMKFSPPGMESYDKYQVRLNKKAAAIVVDECGVVCFINHSVTIKEVKAAFGKVEKHAEGGGNRIAAFDNRPAYVAKNQRGIPDELILPAKKPFFPEIAKYVTAPAD